MYSLLLVDDEIEILQSLYGMLMTSALPLKEIRTASNAPDALAIFERSPFDIIVSDIRMPEMDGLQMIRRTRELWPDTRVVFLTGHREFDYVHSALQLGSHDYLIKPVSDEKLLETLCGAIEELDKKWKARVSLENLRTENDRAFTELRRGFFRELLSSQPASRTRLAELGIPLEAGRPATLLLTRIDVHGGYTDETVHFLIGNVMSDLLGQLSPSVYLGSGEGFGAGIVQEPGEREEFDVLLPKYLQELQTFLHEHMGILLSLAFVKNVPWDGLAGAFTKLTALPAGIQGGFYPLGRGELTALDTLAQPENSSYIASGVREYIDRHYAEPLSLSSLSERFHINPSYLSRIFHRHTGERLSSYISNIRVNEAQRLLRETELKVYEISAHLGFDSPAYFIRVFRKQTGMTPKEYRVRAGVNT